MSQALTRYHALSQSVRSRRRRPSDLKGLDRAYATIQMRLRTRAVSGRAMKRMAEAVDTLRPRYRDLTDDALDAELLRLREGFVRKAKHAGAAERSLLVQGLASVREVARRETGQEAYQVQLVGAIALYHGRIIEMLTGEGKTLTGSLAAALLAWRFRSLHVLTVNDYLAARDAQSRQPIYRRCGLSVGSIQQELDPIARCDVYSRSIVYGTPKQITADWLRDQLRLDGVDSAWAGRARFGMDVHDDPTGVARGLDAARGVWSGGAMVPGLHAALVDEADAVLIDEGVVPLIIAQSRKTDELANLYRAADAIASQLVDDEDFEVDHVRKRTELTERGEARCIHAFSLQSEPVFKAHRRAIELVRTALVARACYRQGRQYAIVEGKIVIVDEFTGRFLADRTWEHGLHQAVEAKESLDITADRETLARLSFQRFFRTYPFLAGMTGTAADATREMESTYQRRVTVIPTNRPVIRAHWPTRVFRNARAKLDALIDSVAALHLEGRPVLVGSRSIQASVELSRRLASANIEHRVLNANFDKDEATIIGNAGAAGAVTVATNMAGRGTDILLDLVARRAGGLHVILSELHGAKRVDRQFIGRAGRQGDPGSAQIFVSLEDELLTSFTPRAARTLHALAGSADELTGTLRIFARSTARMAQRSAEARDRRLRASVLKQDSWVERHLYGR